MSKTQKLSVTLPDGRVITRKTHRVYTHAIVNKHCVAQVTKSADMSWCGRPELAAKAIAGYPDLIA